MVAADVIITNFHVAGNLSADQAGRAVVRFDHEVALDGTKQAGKECRLAKDWLLASSPELDYVLVRLAEKASDHSVPGGTRGFIKPEAHQFVKDEPLIVLQHPAAKPLKLAFGAVIKPADGDRVTYTVNTEGGSSGSPCLTSALQAVALHHWGGPDHNRGVRLGPILKHLNDTGRGALLG